MVNVKIMGAEELIRDLNEFANQTEDKCNKLIDGLLKEGEKKASSKFGSAIYSGNNDVKVRTEKENLKGSIIAEGDSVAFIEFGTGVFNASHPLQSEVSGIVAHGTYGKGRGSNLKGWIYRGEQGNGSAVPVLGRDKKPQEGKWRTFGEPANKCMYDTALELEQLIEPMAKEIFK